MLKLKPVTQVLVIIALALFSTSCASTRTGGNVSSANSAKTITMQEWNTFAQQILTTITPTIERRPNQPVVLAIGDFKNKTSQPLANFSTSKDVMYGQIRKVLVNSGLVEVNMDLAGEGGDVDSLLGELDSLRLSEEYDQSTTTKAGGARAPELVLWGDIITIQFKEGLSSRYDYALNLRLLDAQRRTTVFEEQVQLEKEFVRGLLGG